jgi:hypothetical protein
MSKEAKAFRWTGMSLRGAARLVLSMIVLSLAGFVSSAGAADATIPLLFDQAPVIDGEVDDLWSLATGQIGNIVTEGSAPTSPADCQILWKGLSDATNLYVLVDVNDDALVQDSGSAWDDDRVSIYIDGDNSKDTTTNASAKNDFQFNFRWNNGVVETPSEWYNGTVTGVTYAIARTATGYRLEIKFPWSTLNGQTPREGQLIGFDVGVDDDDDGGGRDTQICWHIPNSPPHDPSKWGTVELVIVSTDKATKPAPANKATDVAADTALGWKPGRSAAAHDVYFGATLSDVNNADRTTPGAVLVSLGQDANSCDPAGLLTLGQTYYWRIDEVNTATGTITRGDLWSFTAEPVAYPITVSQITATASSAGSGYGPQNTINNSGMTGDLHSTDNKAMWLSAASPQPHWIRYDFDRLYRLYELWLWNHNSGYESSLGFGVRNATIEYSLGGTSWTKLGDFEFAQAQGLDDYAHDTTIPFGGVAARSVRITVKEGWGTTGKAGLSEVRFYQIPAFARDPKPASGSAGVDPGVTLSWRSGRGAASHQVYLGSDANAVRSSTTPAANLVQAMYTPSGLQLGATYYWRVDEVNAAQTPATWVSDVWSFSTPDFVTVDDFERYNDTTLPIYGAWLDGYGTTTNGCAVGHAEPPFAERANVHGGSQSMPFYYDNTKAASSEATLGYETAQDWTRAGIKTLVLYFRGDPANTTGQLSLTINATRINYPGNASNLAVPTWKQWNIDLTSIGGLNAVRKLVISVTGTGKGLLYFDDIRLYKSAPAVVQPVSPGTTNLAAYFAFEGDLKDASNHGYSGTSMGATFVDSLAGYGKAIQFNGTAAYADLGASFGSGLVKSLTNCTAGAWVYYTGLGTAWQRVFDFGSSSTVYMFLATRNAGSIPRFAIKTSAIAEVGVSGTRALSVGWHHLAGVIDASTTAPRMALYVDGDLAQGGAPAALPKDLGATTQNWLGRSQFTTDPYLNGTIDDLRIYNRVLTEGEIRYLIGDR